VVRHVRYSRWQSTPARPPQSLWLPVIHHSGRAKLRLSRTRCPNPQRNCPEHAPSSNRRATDATDPYNLCASVLKKLTRDPASTDLGLESPSYAHSWFKSPPCDYPCQSVFIRGEKNIRGTPPVFASSHLHVSPSTRTRTRGLPSAARLTEHRKPKTELVRFPSRLRGFA
jgi:hypothetical protein